MRNLLRLTPAQQSQKLTRIGVIMGFSAEDAVWQGHGLQRGLSECQACGARTRRTVLAAQRSFEDRQRIPPSKTKQIRGDDSFAVTAEMPVGFLFGIRELVERSD
jgi:hypothetical protein